MSDPTFSPPGGRVTYCCPHVNVYDVLLSIYTAEYSLLLATVSYRAVIALVPSSIDNKPVYKSPEETRVASARAPEYTEASDI